MKRPRRTTLKPSLKLELTIPSNIKLLPLIGNLVETFISNVRDEFGNIDIDDLAFKIDLALTEATANAMKHGNKGKEELPVKIKMEFFNDELQIDVSDCGEGFKSEKLYINIDDISENQDSGRGLYIIKKLMDEVTYSYENGQYRFQMTKKIRST